LKVKITHTTGKSFEAKATNGSFMINPTEITPLEYFALGLISCSGVDIVSMAEKNGVELKSFSMTADYVRNEDFPKKFNSVHFVYDIACEADETIVKRWVMASIETYCSTMNTVRNCIDMTYSISLNGTKIADSVVISKIGSEYATEDIGGCCNG
jgi:putative redox protein